MEQLGMFNESAEPVRPRARVTDPVTSHLAAASVTALRESQSAILAMFGGPWTDEELIDRYYQAMSAGIVPAQSESGIRTRRKELVDAGFLVASGMGRSRSGRSSTLWGRPVAEHGIGPTP